MEWPKRWTFMKRDLILLESYKFKVRTREKGNSLKAIADDLNFLDRFKVDARLVRES